ncbi:MAG: ATP-binding protein [Tannerella sp.]|jgi:hypothetical protein|nr:ATP-binding protein [Tannerella sp.]
MKKLPLGIQTFEEIRSKDYVYVDKTEIIYRLVSEGKIYFLSRPRRFGKSLLISTLDALFSGRKDLFEGLYIYDRWDWSRRHPVLRIDWTLISFSTPDEMETNLTGYLKRIAQTCQITLTASAASGCFDELIMLLHDKTGRKVVLLIDEYDKPVTSRLFKPDLQDVRRAVHDFYQVIKGADQYLEFIFITGVSKFSGLSVFSALNNLTDITLDRRYAAICGYTQEELEGNFPEYVDGAAEYQGKTREWILDRIRYWYNGYTWDGQTAVYNPFSTMHFFRVKLFSAYWFHTGTPTFLMDIICRRNNPEIVTEGVTVDDSVFQGYEPSNIGEIPVLFQTGYLTIKAMHLDDEGEPSYTLDIPNMEITRAFMRHLLLAYGKYPDEQHVDNLRKTMERQIKACDEAGLARSLEAMTGAVPYEIGKTDEAWYHSILMIWMRMLGFKVYGEAPNNRGRADLVWEQPGLTVVAEIKYDPQKPLPTLLHAAMKQIHERRYYNRYLGKVILLGIAFSGKNTGCKMELRNDEN